MLILSYLLNDHIVFSGPQKLHSILTFDNAINQDSGMCTDTISNISSDSNLSFEPLSPETVDLIFSE